ncbi:MAG: recombination protein RecO [Campylobacterota bacterium]|nr:recombination protein RecO [Campylobacterota bacterium]
MQGYIIKQNRARDEDLVVSIVTREGLENLYRFYGARHGTVNLGFKIDFESRSSLKSSISQLRDVVHLGFPWLLDYNKLRLWQQFITLFHPHLHQNEAIEPFYFDIIDAAAKRWGKQNSKRVAIETYVSILRHEGRLHEELNCFFCDNLVQDNVSLIRAFLPTHKECSHTLSVSANALKELYATESTLFLDDGEVNILWDVMTQGL